MTITLRISEEEIRAWVREVVKARTGIEIDDASAEFMVRTSLRRGEFERAGEIHVSCTIAV